MKKGSHYPKRTIRLHRGDEIYCTYKQVPPKNGSYFTPNTLRRLFGWVEGKRYRGVVRRANKSSDATICKFMVDFYDYKTNSHQCSHCIYNVELMIVKGELYDIQHKPLYPKN